VRLPKYISPTSLKTWESNRDEYYLKYLAEVRAPRLPQTRPMSVGSAFDAIVKSHLHWQLFGNYGKDNAYEPAAIFEKQVEPHNRDWAKEAGQHVFEVYHGCGALADLFLELGGAVSDPRFEFDLLGELETEIGGVPIMGKPDIYFMNGEGGRVIDDWKVNGYCSKSTISPMPGYVMCRDGWPPSEKKPSARNRMPHKDCVPELYKGIKINAQQYLEDRNEDWATQLSIYAWLLGEEVGSQDLIVGVDQICGQPGPERPWLRVASHRMKVGFDFQINLRTRLAMAWHAITEGHIFESLSRQESQERCQELEEQAEALTSDDPLTQFINSTRFQ